MTLIKANARNQAKRRAEKSFHFPPLGGRKIIRCAGRFGGVYGENIIMSQLRRDFDLPSQSANNLRSNIGPAFTTSATSPNLQTNLHYLVSPHWIVHIQLKYPSEHTYPGTSPNITIHLWSSRFQSNLNRRISILLILVRRNLFFLKKLKYASVRKGNRRAGSTIWIPRFPNMNTLSG